MSEALITAVPPPAEPADHRPEVSAATRHLCTGVYRSSQFRDLIIRRVHNDIRHRLAPSYGFDLVPVVRHAWRAWFLDTTYLAVIAGVLVTGLLTHHALAVVFVGSAALFLRQLHVLAVRSREVFRLKMRKLADRLGLRARTTRERLNDHDKDRDVRFVKIVLVELVVIVALPVAGVFLLAQPIGTALTEAVVITGALAVMAVIEGAVRLRLAASAQRDAAAPYRKPARRLAEIDVQQDPTRVVYDRPPHRTDDPDPLDLLTTMTDMPSPFLGSGKLVNRWLPPLTIQLLRPGDGSMEQREYATPPFAAHHLVDALRTSLAALDTDTGTENLPGLRVRDRVYIAAADLHTAGGPLRGRMGKLEIRGVIDDHKGAGHHFLETSVPIHGGELVATVLIRVSLKGRSLSLDVATCALTRTPEDFQLDRHRLRGLRAVLITTTGSVLRLPRTVARIWQVAGAPVILAMAWWARRNVDERRRRTNRPALSVREKFADRWQNAQQDRTTIYDYMKIIEQRILKAAEDFLESQGVDTSVFKNQATNIINSGVLNMGGQMEVGQMAAGINAQLVNKLNNAEGTAS